MQWYPSSGGMWLIRNLQHLENRPIIPNAVSEFPGHHQVLYLDKLFELYPNTKIIHLIRDGLNSVFGRIKEKHQEVIVKSYKNMDYEVYKKLPKHIRMAYSWKWFIEEGIKHRNNPNYYELYYEDIVNNPSETIDKLFKFLEIKDETVKTNIINSIHKEALYRYKDYPKDKVEDVYNIIKETRKKVAYTNEPEI